MRYVLLGAALLVSHVTPVWAGPAFDRLSKSIRERVRKGEQVLVTRRLRGFAWPRMTIYQVVRATPEEVAATVYDFGRLAKDHSKEIKLSKVVRGLGTLEPDIAYRFATPLGVQTYTIRATVSEYLLAGGFTGYRFKSRSLSSSVFSRMSGLIEIEPLSGEAFISHSFFAVPKGAFKLAPLALLERVDRKAVNMIVRTVEKRRRQRSGLLRQQVLSLRRALAVGRKHARKL